jgi:glutamyl-tRNA synthetase
MNELLQKAGYHRSNAVPIYYALRIALTFGLGFGVGILASLLGWNPGTEKEIFSMDELIEAFTMERIGRSGSRFDPEKARWFNHTYLQKRTNNQLALEFRELLRSRGYQIDIVRLEGLIGMVKERVNFSREIWDQTDFFFKAPEEYDQAALNKFWKNDTPEHLNGLYSVLESIDNFSPGNLESEVKNWIENNGFSTGAIMNAFRLVIVGTLRGPHMYDIISWLGKDETLKRIEKGLSVIGKQK